MSTSAYPKEIVEFLGAEPTPEQWRAISMPLEPYVLVAGAGSGKTSVMAARVIYLALVASGRIEADHDGVLPGNVLCLTFTNKATENLVQRIRRALSVLKLDEGEEPEIVNYHGFAGQILERHGILAGIEPGQRILSQAQRVELCARVLDLMPFEHLSTEWQPTIVDNILTLSDQAQNHLVEPDQIIAFNEQRLEELAAHRSDRAYHAAEERIELAKAAARFAELKRELGVIDFGDQISLALRVVESSPSVAHEYRQRFGAVLLDEFQDTNVAQARLLAAIFGDGHPVTAVGDPDQNIYAWRGASLFNLLEFPIRFAHADGTPAEKLPLYTNFRSGARILAAADTVIGPLPEAQRPDPDKQLIPFAPNGDGEVEIRAYRDEVIEAEAIAERVDTLHDAGHPWREMAVLCRSHRLFASLQRAFNERGVPVEIIGLAGLLKMPEVVEVLAYARAAADPLSSTSLGRILLGPRYRVGFKDLARVAAWAKTKTYDLRREDEDASEEMPFLVAEALEHLDEVEGVSEEGLLRLAAFREELAALRAEARRPVGEFLAEVIRRTGLLTELDAALDVDVATATKRNLTAFLEQVHAFSPLEGELTLRGFLDYVDTVEALDKEEWAPVQPSDDDSVKVMTIHVAKGLEFDTVFVPGLAKGLLPNTTIQHNPAKRGRSLDFELRGDADILPRYEGVLKHFEDALRNQELIEERRICYVALTRARKRLFVSTANWYGETIKAKGPGKFFHELAEWAESSGLALLDRGPELEEENPLAGYREAFVRDWPGPARPDESDSLFPEGWRRAAAETADTRSVQTSFVDALTSEDREGYVELSQERRALASHLVELERRSGERRDLPVTVSVGGAIEYARCPKRFYWTSVRPLPRFSGPAARIGTEIHRWIELQSQAQGTLLETDDVPDLTSEELAGQPGKIDRLRSAFVSSRFAGKVPRYAERPFLLPVEGFYISGRIDAIYGTDGGPWEVVDYKTGRKPAEDDELARAQLDLYALACLDVWHKRPDELTLTYLYLASEDEVSYPVDDPDEIRARVGAWLKGVAAGEFEPTPGPQCRWCDFSPFCDAGKQYLSEQSSG
ncbi:MAG: ATP-dependent DNA helicase [Actinomycetota bacterium]